MADIDGTNDNDSLNGTAGTDTIDGGGANDTLNGGGGNDTLNGGDGNDAIYGDNNSIGPKAEDTTDTTVANNFQVISLGNPGVIIDPVETGGTSGISENGGLLNDAQFGRVGAPLSANVVDLLPGTGNGDGQYDGDNSVSNETFFINGAEHTFDGSAIYDNTIVTFEDGSTAVVAAVVFQDTAGNLYLAPESFNNIDTPDYTSQPITSIQLGTHNTSGATGNGLTAARVADSWVENSEIVTGPAGDDVIDGGGGNDSIYGEGGSDSISGGLGDDTIFGDATEAQIIGDDFTNGAWSGSATLSSDRVTFDADNQWSNAVTTTPTGMSSGPGAGGGAQITLDFAWADGPTPAASGSAVFYLGYDGVNYVTITTPVDGTEATIAYANGATGPAGPIPEGDLSLGTGFTTLTFDLPPGVADFGELVFWSDTSGGVTDDIAIENIIVTRDGHITAPGNDTIDGGAGADLIDGGEGDDLLEGGIGNDTVLGGFGSDTILLNDSYGGDSITGGEDAGDTDSDAIDASGITADGVDVSLSGDEAGTITSTQGTANFTEIEQFFLTDQDDVFQGANSTTGVNVDGGGGSDSLAGGTGDDTLSGGTGNDTLRGGDGTDSLTGGDGDDLLFEGIGGATLDGGEGSDRFEIGFGNSTIIGGDTGTNVDTLSAVASDDPVTVIFDGAGSGNYTDLPDGDSGTFTGIEAVEGSSGADSIDGSSDTGGLQLSGNAGQDTISGGSGADTISGGTGNDALTGGDGDDVFTYTQGDGLDTISDFNTGNTGTLNDGDNTNNDFFDLSAFYDNIAELQDDYLDDGTLNQSNEGNVVWGQVIDYSDNTSFDTNGTPGDEGIFFTGQSADGSSFTQENTGVVCFAAGTLILTNKGEVPVERLRVDDKIMTYDNGLQPLAMLASRRLGAEDLDRNPALKPIQIKPGAIGFERGVVVSPQHMMLVRLDGEEAFARARQLSRLDGGAVRVMKGCRQVTYFHLAFDAHQVVFANGRPAESFFPGPRALAALDAEARREFQALFPDVRFEDRRAKNPKGWNLARSEIPTRLLPGSVKGVHKPRLYPV